MSASLIAFLIETILPWVLRNLPGILNFIATTNPPAHAEIVDVVKGSVSKDQGPNFDWHSGP